jgi:alpha-ribazole phosphatase
VRLFLLRHGRPSVADGVCYGSTDVAVAASEHKRVLRQSMPQLPPGATIFSSPSRRCHELASQLAARLQSPLIYDERLREMHFGAWEMQAWDAIPRTEIDAWAADPQHYRPGGGDSVLQVTQRVVAFCHDLRSRAEKQAILVCHAGTMRLLMCRGAESSEERIAADAASCRHRIAYGDLLVIDLP